MGDEPKSDSFPVANGLSLDTFVDIDAATREAYRFFLTPLIIVVGNNGIVEKVWPGAFNRETKPEVERYFDISVADDVE